MSARQRSDLACLTQSERSSISGKLIIQANQRHLIFWKSVRRYVARAFNTRIDTRANKIIVRQSLQAAREKRKHRVEEKPPITQAH